MTQTPATETNSAFCALLVEDDPELAELLKESLRADHITVAVARNGREALESVQNSPFDLVLLDLGLPGMDGFVVLQQLRQRPDTLHVPVIVLTAKNDTGDKVRGFELGANDYVTKPFDLVELRARVRSALRTQRLQQELLQANRNLENARLVAEEAASAKADFLATMSHEIRTPMNGVIAMTGLLLQTDLALDQRDFVETIRTSGESLLTIINDILNFSKIASGKMELEQRPMELRACVEESLDLFAAKAAEKNLDLVCRVDAAAPSRVVGDATRLRQILANLVSNAIKFTSSGEVCVEIAARSSDAPLAAPRRQEFQFSVHDTGIGIPADRMNRLFRSFSQVDSSITRQFGGTGLGLAISKGLVELMGGRMWVESAEGRGSTFHFTLSLPVATDEDARPPAPPPATLAGLRVLIVEDGASSRNVLAEQVRRWGMVPLEAENAEQALAILATSAGVELAVIDRQLPGANGLNLALELRKQPGHESLPIAFLNSVGASMDSTETLPASASVNKPVKPAPLQTALVQLRSGTKPATPAKATVSSRLDASMAERFPLSILLADDNAINQKVALRLLQQLGYKADMASNGLEAVRAVEQKPYDVIFMDVQMPEMDGLDATRHIRQRQREPASTGHFNRPITIIAMTANAMHGDREKCVAAGMDDYLPKPVRPEALQSMLELHAAQVFKTAAPTPDSAAKPSNEDSLAWPGFDIPALTVLPKTAVPSTIVEQPPIDLDRLNEFAGGSVEHYNELISLYLRQTTEQLEQVRAAIAENNVERASRVAHSCAGASATCGMDAIVPLLRQVEYLSQEGNLSAAAELLPAIEHEFDRLKRYLELNKPIALAG
jgi:CheY-like chemotaxis protein/HPt (histidine-containing phosphotransfer) domain-containing protein